MIIGFCEVILKSPGVYGKNIPGNLLADLQVVLRNSQHLSGLIDDVLDLSQIEARQMALVKEWVRVDEIVAAAAVAVRPLFESKGLALDVQVAADLPAIYCDRTRIREVLLNLLSNAGRFTERGGVRLRVFAEEARDSGGGTESIQRQAGARGPLALAEQKGSAGAVNVLFSVADDGPGISEEDRQKLFQPFQQLDPTIRRQHGGTGLGLSISKSFVELHEGLMWVESEKGKGTTFFFRLPVEPVLARSGYARWVNPYASYYDKSPRVPDLPAVEKRPRLMVVEARTAGAQDGVGQMVGGGVLERLVKRYLPEVEVTTALDLLTARAALEEDPAQMVLVNTGQGEDPTAALQAAVELPFHTPAVICSIADPLAFILPDDGDSGTGGTNSPGGPEAVLVKPISYDVLLGALERLEESCGRSLRTILIVDDEPDVHRLFWRMLSAAGKGYQVLRAEDGRQALDLLARQPVDAILLDLVMPEMDGFQFLAHRAQDPALCGVPVILISAQDQRGHPIVSNYLVAARSGGLSVQQVLDSIQAFGAILGHS
jgi:CheY-like chemotaxis protein